MIVAGSLIRWSAIALGLGVSHVRSTMVPKSTITEQIRVNGSPFITFLANVVLICGGGTYTLFGRTIISAIKGEDTSVYFNA